MLLRSRLRLKRYSKSIRVRLKRTRRMISLLWTLKARRVRRIESRRGRIKLLRMTPMRLLLMLRLFPSLLMSESKPL